MAIDCPTLTEAVVHWLEYERAIGRAELFDEAYLAYPVGTYLQVHSGGKVRPEQNHPVLNRNAQGRGRRAAVDFVVTRKDGDDWDSALETKFVSRARDFGSELFTDILRLECIVEEFKSARLYLVVAGLGKSLHSLLVNQTGQVGDRNPRQPLFPPVLSISKDDRKREVQIDNAAEPQRSYWIYSKPRNLTGWPSTLTTELLGITGEVSDNSDRYACLAWEIIAATRPLVQLQGEGELVDPQ